MNTPPTSVVRTAVGKSSANIGPKFDHVPVPNPTSQRQPRSSGGQPAMSGHSTVIATSPTAMSTAYTVNAGRRPNRSEARPKEA